MSKSIISQGKTTQDAIEKGLKELNVSKSEVDIKILEEEKRSFYSILAPRIVKVELTVKENDKDHFKEKSISRKNENMEEINTAVQDLKEFLKEFLKNGEEFSLEIKEFDVKINITGNDIRHLIGYRGDVINALQNIVTAVANKKSTSKIKVFLDVGNYREKRKKTLEELAEKIAKTVIRTGKSITLEPMTAYERKIIHSKLQESEKVKTFSKGEEPYRRVVVSLK